MIPDFKTYLRESIWSDIQDRSSGDVVRKEDNIDHLVFLDFCEYVKEHYKIVRPEKEWVEIEWTITDFGNKEYIRLNVPLERVRYNGFTYTYDLYIYYSIADRKIEFMKMPYKYFFRDYPEAKTILEKDYVVDENIKITIKSGEIKNHNVIKTIDDLLTFPKNPFIEKKINESIWSDIQDRSSGDVTRKEDEAINQYDTSEFHNYLYMRYLPTGWNDGETVDQFPSPIHDNTWKIQVPFTHIPKPSGVGYFAPPITMCFSGSNEKLFDVILSSKLIDKYPDTEKILGNDYKFEYPQKYHPSPHIVKKNGQMTNLDCVKIIDRLLNMVDEPLFKLKS